MTKKKKPKKPKPPVVLQVSIDDGKNWHNMTCVPNASFTDRLNLEKK